jgi:hypothetical protein
MIQFKTINDRIFSVIGFSLLFAYLLSFLFEGQVLYSILAYHDVHDSTYIVAAIVAHFAGLFSCGYLVKSPIMAKYTMLSSMGVCLIATLPYFFAPSALWLAGLIVSISRRDCGQKGRILINGSLVYVRRENAFFLDGAPIYVERVAGSAFGGSFIWNAGNYGGK